LIHSTQRPIPVVEIDVVQNELFVVAMVGDRGLNHCIVIRDPSSKLLSRRFFWQQNGFHGHATANRADGLQRNRVAGIVGRFWAIRRSRGRSLALPADKQDGQRKRDPLSDDCMHMEPLSRRTWAQLQERSWLTRVITQRGEN
jgi:hypothetical protein